MAEIRVVETRVAENWVSEIGWCPKLGGVRKLVGGRKLDDKKLVNERKMWQPKIGFPKLGVVRKLGNQK